MADVQEIMFQRTVLRAVSSVTSAKTLQRIAWLQAPVLCTSGSSAKLNHMQHAAQNQTSCADAFISFLLKRIRDPNRPAITRTACAAYLASFLARAKFLGKPLLVQSLLDMATWCADYCKTQDQRQTMSAPPASNTYDMGVHHQVTLCSASGHQHGLYQGLVLQTPTAASKLVHAFANSILDAR